MAVREKAIIKAILKAILNGPRKLSFLRRFISLFTLLNVPLQRYRHDLFRKLRQEAWHMDEEAYWASFQLRGKNGKTWLHSLNELGYSGSVSVQ
jgi:hypothetical protein